MVGVRVPQRAGPGERSRTTADFSVGGLSPPGATRMKKSLWQGSPWRLQAVVTLQL